MECEEMIGDIPGAWAARAPELARWALECLFVRTDRHGGYRIVSGELVKRTIPEGGPRDGAVNETLLERHFRASGPADIIGAHTLVPGTSGGKWCALDLDNHDDDPELLEANRAYAEGRHAHLTALGLRPLVLDYGAGSFHILALFDRTLPGATLKRFGEWVRGDQQQHEVFPKQTVVPADGYGNWLRCPGRHHARDVWARVYDGADWLEGAAAVEHLLSLTGDSPDLIPEEVRFPPAGDGPGHTTGRETTGRESVFAAYNRAATLDEMVSHCLAAGHTLVSRSSDRATFTRAGKANGESFNLRAMHGTVLCYNFSANAGLPENKGLNPSHTRCALMFGGVSEDNLRKLAPILEAELGIMPRRVPLVFTPTSTSTGTGTDTDDEPNEGTKPPAWWQPPADGEAWTDPHRIARLFIRATATPTPDGTPTVVQWRDEFYRWDGGAYRPVGGELDAHLARHARELFAADLSERRAEAEAAAEAEEKPARPVKLPPVTGKVRADALVNLSGLAHAYRDRDDAPFWLRGEPADIDLSEVVIAPNGLFTLDAIARGDGPFAAPTPDLFALNALPFAVPVGECDPPRLWLEKLDEWFNADPCAILGLQEWLGLLLSGDTSHHKILLLVGPPRSGKGTIVRTITHLVGAANVATTSFAALGESFGLQDLIGKSVAVIPDARLSGRTDTAAVVERLLSVSGGDSQTVNRKNMPRITTRLGVRFVLATNEIPRLADASGALASRFHILAMPRSFLGKEDKQLDAKLAAELPAILQWAAKGYVRLRTQGAFTQNEAAARHHQQLEELSSPVRAFVRERCSIGPTERIRKSELYAAWCDFCEDRALMPSADNAFGRDLRTAYPHVADAQVRQGAERVRLFRGIGLRPRDDWGAQIEPTEPTRRNETEDDICTDWRVELLLILARNGPLTAAGLNDICGRGEEEIGAAMRSFIGDGLAGETGGVFWVPERPLTGGVRGV